MSHENNGDCIACTNILDKYPGFSQELTVWFYELQIAHPELHVSCGGRGRIDQEALFERGATRAHWLQSAHNFNLALDVFFLIDGQYNLDQSRFDAIIAPALNPKLEWYGAPGSVFYERPHIEIKNFKDLVSQGIAKPVE